MKRYKAVFLSSVLALPGLAACEAEGGRSRISVHDVVDETLCEQLEPEYSLGGAVRLRVTSEFMGTLAEYSAPSPAQLQRLQGASALGDRDHLLRTLGEILNENYQEPVAARAAAGVCESELGITNLGYDA